MLFASIALFMAGTSLTDTVRITGDRVVVEPTGVAFDLPAYWRDSTYRASHKREGCGAGKSGTIYSRPPQQRSQLESARGEWDAEYSSVADSVLPLDALVIHAGAEGWGADSHCYNDLQMRVYVVDAGPSAVMADVSL